MRDYVKSITQTVEQSVSSATEEITTIVEDKSKSYINVGITFKDSDSNTIGTENVMIVGDHYTLLMSANPEFATSKPENEYRESDLWYIIDLIRAS